MNMLKDILRTVGIIIYTAMLIATGWYIGRGYEAKLRIENLEVRSENTIPTIEQIQLLVGCEKIDGKLGPETMAKWNRAVCDQYAAKYFTSGAAPTDFKRNQAVGVPAIDLPGKSAGEGKLCRGK
jgi:hypothetical protein